MPEKNKRRTYETPAEIRALKRPASGQVEWYDAVAPKLDPPASGLGVRVSSRGTKSFTLNYRFLDKKRNKRVPRRDTIGRFSENHPPHDGIPQWHPRCPLTLKEARAVAAHMLKLSDAGIDPQGERERAEADEERARANTYSSAVKHYVKRWHVQREKNTSADLTQARLLRVNPQWHDLPVAKITQGDIEATLDEVMDDGKRYEANRRWTALRHFFQWLKKRKIIAENPTIDIDKPWSGETSRERHWDKDELKAIWKAADKLGDAKRAAWLRVMILTGARPNEVAGMRRDELDLDAGVWIVPPERHKTGKRVKSENVYELAPLAVRIMKGLLAADPPPNGNPYVFYGEGTRAGDPNFFTLNTRLRNRIKMLSRVPDYYEYAARHTFATGLKDVVKAPPHIVAACLNHRPRGVTAGYMHGSYQPEMREACEKWADYIERVVYPKDVVGLHG